MKTRAFCGTLYLLDAEDRLLITSALRKSCEHCRYYMARYYTPQEEQLFCNVAPDLLQQGTYGRRETYIKLVAMGLNGRLCELACSSRDGLLAIPNIQRKTMFQYTVSREFAYAPISLRSDLNICRKELVYRCLRGYGPVTLRDTCYFSGWKKKELEAVLQKIRNVQVSNCSGSAAHEFPEEIDAYSRIPTAVFLSSFDPLMLGYEEHESPFSPQRRLRRVFNLQGIIYPCSLYRGSVTGCWELEKETLQSQSFEDFGVLQRQQVEKAARQLLQPARIIWADF